MVSFSCYKFFRALRSMCAPISAVIGFSLMLTYIFILHQPSRGPGLKQRMGWQAYEVVNLKLSNNPTVSTGGELSTGHSQTGDTPDTGVDWWNVTNQEETVDYSSFPLDVWSPTLPHNTGFSEIAISRCFTDPEVAGDLCGPDTTVEEDAIKGKWVLVPRNLNTEGGYLSLWLNLYYRRTRRQDTNLVVDLKILSASESLPEEQGWHSISTSLHEGIRGLPPLYLWYQTGKQAGEMTPQERANVITELDVLFGEDVPWYGFEKVDRPTIDEQGRVQATWVTYRRGVKLAPKAPPLHFNRQGKFKILQVADLHFSVSQGECRDTDLDPCEHSDNLTSALVSRVLDKEKPDLVIFTGDQLNGQGTSWDPKSVLAKFSRAVTDKGIPWAAVFGNHDEEDGMRKEQQVMLMKSLPYSLVERGPKDIHGVGNYVLKVYSPDASKTHTLTMYFLDSGSYQDDILAFLGARPTEYDYIRTSQIDWFLQESALIEQIERPFRPDDGKDLGHAWGRQEQITPTMHRLAKPNALMFFHMPLPETYAKPDRNPLTGKPLDVGISGIDDPGNAKDNDGFFEEGVLKASESLHVANGNAHEVKVIGNGHCHVTENCRRVKGVWFCFGGGGSYSGYGKIGFDRRFRIYDISDYGETIKTYKRTEKDEIVDEMILAGPGAAPLS